MKWKVATRSTNNQGDEQMFVMQHMATSMIGGVLDNNVWYVDSKASTHMTSHGEWFKDTKDLKTLGFMETSDDTTHPITQIGKVPLSMQDGQTKYLENVFHVPTITKNLVSIGQMVEQGLHVTFNPNGCFVEDINNQGKLIAKGKRNRQMFTLDVNMPKVNYMLFIHEKGAGDIGIWHKRVGHVNLQRFKLMEKQNLVGGFPKFGIEKVMSEVCEACQLGKQARHPFPVQTTCVSSKPLEMIHSDVWTTKTESIGGCKYYVSFIDDHTKVWVYFMKHKDEVFQHILNFKAMVEKGVSIKCLRFDGRGKYFSKEFSEYLKEHGIQRKYSCSYSPQ
jgi:hypothetical protein